jgi:hypothetical protein
MQGGGGVDGSVDGSVDGGVDASVDEPLAYVLDAEDVFGGFERVVLALRSDGRR